MNATPHSNLYSAWTYGLLSLALGLIFQFTKFVPRHFHGQELILIIPMTLFTLCLIWVLSALSKDRINSSLLGKLWVLVATFSLLVLLLSRIADWQPAYLFGWVFFPLVGLLISIHLGMAAILEGRALAVRMSNAGFFMGIGFLVGWLLEGNTSAGTTFWLTMALSIGAVGLATPSLLKISASEVPNIASPALKGKWIAFLGPLSIAAGIAVSLSFLFWEMPYDPELNAGRIAVFFILASMTGCALAYRGISRFGPYRHLCQSALLIVLLCASLPLSHSFWSWVLVGCIVFYLLSTILVALACLWLSARIGRNALEASLGLLLLVCIGILLGSIFQGDPLTSRLLWLTAMTMLVGLICLQQLLNRLQILSRDSNGSGKAVQTDWLLRDVPLHGQGKPTWMSRFFRRSARIVAEIFFGRIRIEGAHYLQKNKNVILVANHPNTFLDPLIITALSPGRLHYWAKSTLWKLPILGSILDRMGAIPVFRQQDSQKDQPKGDNQLSIALAARKANQGAWILIFPEGGSQVGLSLKPLKTGTARVAFRAVQEIEWQDDVAIVPVGLDYLEPSIFRTDLTIRIGEPIGVKSYREDYEISPRSTVVAVTDRVSLALQQLLPHLEAPQLEKLVHQISDLYGDHLCRIMGEADPLQARKDISQAINHYQQMDPDTLLLFSQRLDAYDHQKDRLSTPENHPPIPFKELLRILSSLVSFVTFGIISNWVPYKLVQKIITTLQPSPVWLGSAKLLVGGFTFGLYYLIWGLITYRLFGGLAAFLIVASFIISAFIALGALDRFAFRINQLKLVWQAFWTQDTNDDLEDMKMSLIQDLERFREAYAFYRGNENTAPAQE